MKIAEEYDEMVDVSFDKGDIPTVQSVTVLSS